MKAETCLNVLSYYAYVVAGASYFYSWNDSNSYVRGALIGAQSFAIASLFDQVLRAFLARHRPAQNTSLTTTLLFPLIEEGMYSGALLTQSNWEGLLRFPVAMWIGSTAARALTGRVTAEQNKQGFTVDTKIGFFWAIAREALVQVLPTSSAPLIVIESCVFGLVEVCPTNDGPEIPKFSPQWSYKVLSGAVFRGIANTVAQKHGIIASIVQHVLFNISRYQEKAPTFVNQGTQPTFTNTAGVVPA